MTITQMRYFYEVCKWQNITKAAASLHVSQPTVSIAMSDLEKESGLNLFRREGKKLSLTEDGTLLLSKITPILANLQQLDRDIKDMAQNKNLIRLAVPLQIGVQLIPTLFSGFKKLHPEIELEVVEAGGIDSLRMIENEELDLAITNYDDTFSPNLHYRKLFKSEACFCTYPQHPLAQKKFVEMKDIADEPFVLLNGGFFCQPPHPSKFSASADSPQGAAAFIPITHGKKPYHSSNSLILFDAASHNRQRRHCTHLPKKAAVHQLRYRHQTWPANLRRRTKAYRIHLR